MNGIRKSSPPPPLTVPGQLQPRNYYPIPGQGSEDYQGGYQQQGQQQQYPLQPVNVQQGGNYELVKSPGFGAPHMPGPGLGHPQQPPASMYQPQQRGVGGGNTPFYQPNNPNVSVRQRFPSPGANQQGMYMPVMYQAPFGPGGGQIIVNSTGVSGQMPQQRMPSQPYSGGLPTSQPGLYHQQIPQTSFNQTYNPPIYYSHQQQRPPSTQGPTQPTSKPPRKVLTIVDPVSGKDVTSSILQSTGDAPPQPDTDSRSTPVVEPPVAQSPKQTNEIAAQFAAAVAAKLYSGGSSQPNEAPLPDGNAAPPMGVPGGPVPVPDQGQMMMGGENNQENYSVPQPLQATSPPMMPNVQEPPPSLPTEPKQQPPANLPGAIQTHSSSLSNGDAPPVVAEATKPAPIPQTHVQTDKDCSVITKKETTPITDNVKVNKQQNPAEPVSVSVKPVERTNISATTSSSASNTRETTPEVNIVPPTPVDKTQPDKKFNIEEAAPKVTEPVSEVSSFKKDKPKKRAKELNKKGDRIQGSDLDAYTDNVPTVQDEEAAVTTEAPTKPDTPDTISSTVTPDTTQEPPQAPPAETVTAPPKVAPGPTATPAVVADSAVTVPTSNLEVPGPDDGMPQVEIKVEDTDLEEGEIVDDDEDEMELKYKYQEDQWSPLNPEGKKHYDREFLLQFQYESAATSKPAGLPDIPDIVLDKPVGMVQGGRQYNRELSASSTGSDFIDFTPKYVWSGTGGGSKSRGLPRQPSNQKNKNAPPPRQINLSISKDIELHKAKEAWKPGHEKDAAATTKESESDEAATADLYKKTRSILNKLTPQKFQILLSQMQALKIDSENRLKGVIDLVFEKAISEPNFSVAYANMCRCLSMFKVQSETKPGEMVNFRAVLLTRCQREFEKDKSSEAVFQMKREEIEKTEDTAKKEELKQELNYEESKAKRRSLGNIRFIGELFKLKMLTENIMHDCVFKLLRTKDPENLECLCRLLTTIGKELDTDKAKPRMEQYFQQMSKIVNDKKNSARVRFMLQDVVDLRMNKWVPRRVDNNPKTIDQIHKEVAQENQEKAFLSQQNQIQQKTTRGGGRRGGPPEQRGGADGWNTVGAPRTPLKSVDRSIDPSKMKFSKQNVDENVQLGPGGGAGKFSGWGRGSTGGTSGRASMEKERPNTPANRFSALSKPDEETSRRYGGSSPARGDSRTRGGFGRPPALGARQSQESEREKAVAAAKAIGGGQSAEGGHRERSRGRDIDSRPAEAPAPPASELKVLSNDEMEKKTKAILDEYFQIHDIKEATLCVRELCVENHYHFVYNAINHVLERSAQARKQAGTLLHDLAKQSIISEDSYVRGLVEVLQYAEDLEIDIPMIWKYYGELISPMVQDGSVPLSFLKEATKPLIQINKAGVLLAEILHDASHRDGHKKVAGLWTASGLQWSDFVPRNQVDQFLVDKDLEFTKGGDSVPTTPTTGLPMTEISEKLHELIVVDKSDNETVFDWIESSVDEPTTKRPNFIRALMTAVCNSAIKGDKGKERLEPKEITTRNDLLQKYLDHQPVSELQALYALQVLITRLEHPPGLLRSMFDTLYDDDIISEDAFFQWEKSEEEPEGKGAALKQAVQFFTWLKEAEDES